MTSLVDGARFHWLLPRHNFALLRKHYFAIGHPGGVMTSSKLYDRGFLLVLAGGFSMALALQAAAQALPPDDETDQPAMEAGVAAGVETETADIDPAEVDWSLLHYEASPADPSRPPRAPKPGQGADASWSSKNNANGASNVSVKQSLSAFLDTRIGADMTVVNQPQTLTAADLLRQKALNDSAPSQSSGSAWAAITAPGVGSIWDKTAVEARVDPAQEQSRLGTSLSKSVPLNEQYSLTLQNGYNLIQQGIIPVPGISAHPSRNYQSDQSAKLSIAETGTSFTASQSLSSTDDKWLRKVGAEQKLFGGVNVSASIGETPQGAPNKSLSAGFKQSW
jgi:hypothetical protein